MTNAPRVTKANGHIVQADWNQTDPLKMDYIHNKPEIPAAVTDEHIANIANMQFFGLGEYTEDLDFIYDVETKSWNKDPCKIYWGNKDLSLGYVGYGKFPSTLQWWVVKGELIAETSYMPYIKQTLLSGALETEFYRYFTPDSNGWTAWRTDYMYPNDYASAIPPTGVYYDSVVGLVHDSKITSGLRTMAYGLGDGAGNIPRRDVSGDLYVPANPGDATKAASKGYVDKLNKQTIYRPYLEKTFKLSDCTYQIVGSGSLIWFLMCSLPDFQFDVSTRTMISVSNVPAAPYFTGGTHDFLNIMSDGAKNIYTPLLSSTDSGYVNHGMVTTEEGMVYFQLGETMGGTLTTDNLEAFLAHYADMEFTIMYTDPVEDEPRDYQSIKLYSNSILDYNAPTDTINIADLVSCEGHIDEWTIHFITASNTSPFVTMPLQINGNYVSWVNGEPEFIGATRYTVTFRRIGKIIYATCVDLDNRGGEN